MGRHGILSALTILACLSAQARESFQVVVTEPSGLRRVDRPVAISTPLPEGAVTDLSQVRLLSNGGEVTTDLQDLDRWPDGSVRWIRLEWVAGRVSPGTRQAYTVEYGPEIERARAEPMRVDQTPRRVRIDNGLLTVVIGTHGIERLSVNGKVVATGDAVRVIDSAGRLYDCWGGTPKVTVRRHGAVAVEIDVNGGSSRPFNHRSRYTIYRGSPIIRRQTYIESTAEVQVQLVSISALQASDGLDTVSVQVREPVTLKPGPGQAVCWHMTAPSPETWVLAEVNANGEARVRAEFEANPPEDSVKGVAGERPGYFIDLSGADRGVTLACELRRWGTDANASCAIAKGKREVSLNAHGMWPQLQGDIYQGDWTWYEGVAKNFESFIIAHDGSFTSEAAERALAAYAPLYAMADAAYVRRCNVFGLGDDGLEYEPVLEPIRRWVGLAQITITEYEKLKRPNHAEGIGGLISGEIYRQIYSRDGTGGDPNRAMNDSRHWFAEAFRKADGQLLRDATEIAYAEMDYGMYHAGNPDLVGKNHYHGNWRSVSSGAYGCRSFPAELAYLATGDDYFLDAWQLELGAQMKVTRWGARSGGYSMVDLVWGHRRFPEAGYLTKANEAFRYVAARQRPDGAITQNLQDSGPLKPWMMGIAMEGALELHRVDPSAEKLQFLRGVADWLVNNQMPDGSWAYIVRGEGGGGWKQGAGTATVAPQMIRLYELTKDIRYLISAQRALSWLLNARDTETDIIRARHAIWNSIGGRDPSHTTCSYIFSIAARMSGVSRRAGLPFLIQVPSPLSPGSRSATAPDGEHWGVTAITNLSPGSITFETAAPRDAKPVTVKIGGFQPGMVLSVRSPDGKAERRADGSGVLACEMKLGGRVAVKEQPDGAAVPTKPMRRGAK